MTRRQSPPNASPFQPPRRARVGTLGRAIIAPWFLVAGWLDLADEALAKRRRQEFGRRQWLLSWSRDPDGQWKARLSGPETVRTIERSARTRAVAIDRTARALRRLPVLRRRLHPGPRVARPDGKRNRFEAN